MKPSTTFTVLSQPPDFGIFLSMVGKRANTVNGMARAIAKPVIPTTGPITLPRLAASTKRVPIIGPVQENDTITSVAAMKKMLSSTELNWGKRMGAQGREGIFAEKL